MTVMQNSSVISNEITLKAPRLKRLSEILLVNVSPNKCKQYAGYAQYFFTAAYAILGLIPFGGYWYIKPILIVVIVILQITTSKIFSYRLVSDDNLKDTALNELDAKVAELHEMEKSNHLLKALNNEVLTLIDALMEMKLSCDVKAFYTKVLFAIKEMTKTVSNIPNENLAFHLYVYDTNKGTIKRVAVCNSVQTLETSEEMDAVSIKSVKRYYYAKCIKKDNQILFSLKCNAEIRKYFYFKKADEGIKQQYTQYIATAYRGSGHLKFYVEIISFNGVRMYDSADDFHNKVMAPFSSLFKLIDAESHCDQVTLEKGA